MSVATIGRKMENENEAKEEKGKIKNKSF